LNSPKLPGGSFRLAILLIQPCTVQKKKSCKMPKSFGKAFVTLTFADGISTPSATLLTLVSSPRAMPVVAPAVRLGRPRKPMWLVSPARWCDATAVSRIGSTGAVT
jgi:hypothetical protein